jgi:hypothetical protein
MPGTFAVSGSVPGAHVLAPMPRTSAPATAPIGAARPWANAEVDAVGAIPSPLLAAAGAGRASAMHAVDAKNDADVRRCPRGDRHERGCRARRLVL